MDQFVIVEARGGYDVGFFLRDMAYIEYTDKVRPPHLIDGVKAVIYFKGTTNSIGVAEKGLEKLKRLLHLQSLINGDNHESA